MYRCRKCGRETEFKPAMRLPGVGIVLSMRSHADAERWAWYCPKCNGVYCGQCCLPEWQALKAKEGLSGDELAAKLEREPYAFFGEQATCPVCRTNVLSELQGRSPQQYLAPIQKAWQESEITSESKKFMKQCSKCGKWSPKASEKCGACGREFNPN